MKTRARSDQTIASPPGDVSLTAPRVARVLVSPETERVERAQKQILPHLLAAQAQTTAAFLFLPDDLAGATQIPDRAGHGSHDDILRAQALLLATHVSTLYGVLSIDDIYAHPLIHRRDILSGHCLRSFAGAPLRDSQYQLFGVICTIDTTVRCWSDRDMRILKRIVAQFETCRLSQF